MCCDTPQHAVTGSVADGRPTRDRAFADLALAEIVWNTPRARTP